MYTKETNTGGKKFKKKTVLFEYYQSKKIFYNIILCIIIDLTELRPIPIDMS